MLPHNFFSDSCRLLNCLLQHRNLCSDKLVLAYLSFLSFFVAIEFYYSIAFIVAIEKFFVAIEIPPLVLHYVATKTSLSQYSSCIAFQLLVVTEISLLQQSSPQPHVFFCRDKVLLPFIVNSKFYVATKFSLLRQKSFLELVLC